MSDPEVTQLVSDQQHRFNHLSWSIHVVVPDHLLHGPVSPVPDHMFLDESALLLARLL
jgi:hypothetical protein